MTAATARRLRRGGAAGLILLFALFGAGLVFRSLPHELPAPSGPFSVGRTDLLLDRNGDPLSPSGAPPAGSLLLVLWYPTVAGAPGFPARYIPPRVLAEVEKQAGIGRFLYQDLRSVRAQSIADAPISLQHASYPVVLLLPFARTVPFSATSLAEQMASNGWVVAAFSPADVHRYLPGSLPSGKELDGTSAPGRPPAELSTVASALSYLRSIDQSGSGQFSARLDLSRLAIVGMGESGEVAAQAADSIGESTGPFVGRSGLPVLVPVVQLGSSAAEGGGPAVQPRLLVSTSGGVSASGGAAGERRGTVTVRVPDARALDFTDVGFIYAPLPRLSGKMGAIRPERMRRITAELIETFVEGAWSAADGAGAVADTAANPDAASGYPSAGGTAQLFRNAAAAARVAVKEKAASFGLNAR